MVCRRPQSQEGDWARPHLCKPARHGPRPVRKRFTRDRVWRERSKPSCQIVGSATIVWLTTEADDQSSVQCVIVSTDVMSDRIGRRDASRGGGCSKTSAHRPIWTGFGDLKHTASRRPTTQRRRNATEHREYSVWWFCKPIVHNFLFVFVVCLCVISKLCSSCWLFYQLSVLVCTSNAKHCTLSAPDTACVCFKCSFLPWYLTVVFYRTVVCLALCVFCATVNVLNKK